MACRASLRATHGEARAGLRPAPTRHCAFGCRGRAAAWRLPAGLRRRRGSYREAVLDRVARAMPPKRADRRALRRLRNFLLCPRGPRPCRRVGRRRRRLNACGCREPAGLAGRIEAMQRDLVRQPLRRRNWPVSQQWCWIRRRLGRRRRCRQIATPYRLRHLCELQSRDAGARRRPCTRGGYLLVSARPIDQFLWSARLESVSSFRR